MNYKIFLVFSLGFILISSTLTSSFADVISPRQQMHLDFTVEQIICNENLVKIIKKSSGNAACVKPTSAEKLAQKGWASTLSEKKLEEIKDKKTENESAGTITKIATVKQESNKADSDYVYIFEACAKSKGIQTPEIIVKSDSQTKKVKLASILPDNSCYPSSVQIKALDPNSISAEMLNMGGISEKITSLETKIANLKDKISVAKQNLLEAADPVSKNASLDSIDSMKKELKNLQDQLRRYLMVLNISPYVKATDFSVSKSFTGQPLEGMSTKIISIIDGFAFPKLPNPDLKKFNVVFEACTGNETIRLPIIDVVSDSDSVTVKLVNRIIPNSCQIETAKINAMDAESIILKIGGNSGLSTSITEVEKQIDELKTKLSEERHKLDLLPFGKTSSFDSKKKEEIVQVNKNISELRSELLETRAKLYGLMLQN